MRQPVAEACSACDAPMTPADRFCGECGTPAFPPSAGPPPPVPAAAPAGATPSPPVADPARRRRLPTAGWILILYAAIVGASLLLTFSAGPQWPEDDPVIAPLLAGSRVQIVLTAVLGLAVIGVLSRARWGFGLAVLAMAGYVALRGIVFVWLVLAIQSYYGDDAIADILGELLSAPFWIYGLGELLVLTGLLMSRQSFRQRIA